MSVPNYSATQSYAAPTWEYQDEGGCQASDGVDHVRDLWHEERQGQGQEEPHRALHPQPGSLVAAQQTAGPAPSEDSHQQAVHRRPTGGREGREGGGEGREGGGGGGEGGRGKLDEAPKHCMEWLDRGCGLPAAEGQDGVGGNDDDG